MNDPYVLPNGVLHNRLGITDAAALAAAEADITRARLLQVDEHAPPGEFDLAHLCRFHAAIFGDLYDWAGELRTVDISKDTPFCPVQNLAAYAAEVFGRLAAADHLRGLARGDFVRAAAELYGDINALHPFREGNGRAQRAFLAELSRRAGWLVNWTSLSPEENREASIKSFRGDNQPLERMLDRLVSHEPG
ncbi:Fic/DOC family protein [Streptomyces cyaneus]|uniref:Fic/DOC family protein n=1 Tax=Streptomyces cyaneus TaxID=1904 RepID=UPI000FF87F66|nr:Fic family protein [Streptomyces cyaneus]